MTKKRDKIAAGVAKAVDRRRRSLRTKDTPHGRLMDDGCYETPSVRKRILGLALMMPEIPAADIQAALKCTTYEAMRFCSRHHISYDYLLGGDLRGLQETLRGRYLARDQLSADRRALARMLGSIPSEKVATALQDLQRLAGGEA